MADEGHILVAADELARGQVFEGLAGQGLGVELPVEGFQRARVAEVGLAQTALDTPFSAAVGRDPEQAVEELQLGQAFFLGRGEQLVEFVFGQGIRRSSRSWKIWSRIEGGGGRRLIGALLGQG